MLASTSPFFLSSSWNYWGKSDGSVLRQCIKRKKLNFWMKIFLLEVAPALKKSIFYYKTFCFLIVFVLNTKPMHFVNFFWNRRFFLIQILFNFALATLERKVFEISSSGATSKRKKRKKNLSVFLKITRFW